MKTPEAQSQKAYRLIQTELRCRGFGELADQAEVIMALRDVVLKIAKKVSK